MRCSRRLYTTLGKINGRWLGRKRGVGAGSDFCLLHFHVGRHGLERLVPPFRGRANGGGRGRDVVLAHEIVKVVQKLPLIEPALLPACCCDALELAGRLGPRKT